MRRRHRLAMFGALWLTVCGATAGGIYALPYQFTDDANHTVRIGEWQGRPTVIAFAYATCRKICVETLQVMQRLQAEADRAHQLANFIVLSYDPHNDTPAVWADYRRTHHLERANWHFLTGSDEATQAVAQWLGIEYWLYDEHVMHDFNIVLLDDRGIATQTMDWSHRDAHWF